MFDWIRNAGERKEILAITAFVLLAAGIAGMISYFSGESLLKAIGAFVFVFLLMLVGILKAKYKRVDRAIEIAFGKYFQVTFWLLVTLAPITFFFWLSRFILDKSSFAFQLIVLIAWGFVLATILSFIATDAKRKKLYAFLEKVGGFAPFVYCFNAFFISIIFFGTVSFILADSDQIAFANLNGEKLASSDLAVEKMLDFFLWHFLDAVPLLKINETLRWKMQISYTSGSVGFIVLFFKIVVILPVISAFRGYWKYRQTKKEGSDS